MPQDADTDLDLTAEGTISQTGSKPQARYVLSGSGSRFYQLAQVTQGQLAGDDGITHTSAGVSPAS